MEVFGTIKDNAIFLPSTPYQVRLNCKDGGLFVGGSEPENRRSNPKDKIAISIIKIGKFFGDLGKTKGAVWLQIFFVPSPTVKPEVLPQNVVCVAYIKKQSVTNLNQMVTQVMSTKGIEPAEGVFEMSFVGHKSELGTYYSIDFQWRERNDAEKKQLDAIKEFWVACHDQLIDIDGTRDMRDISSLSAVEVQQLVESSKPELLPSNNHQLAPTK
ncbi:MAG: hypothetical protein IGQ45_15820 [Cyanobacterium sp. T60_A2020_053]|nr:hypothetical protein [Cyanobacterium sp. T60_A2020_053]